MSVHARLMPPAGRTPITTFQVAAIVVAILVATGCSGDVTSSADSTTPLTSADDHTASDVTGSAAQPAPTSSSSASLTPDSLGNTDLNARLTFVLGLLNGEELDRDGYRQTFAPTFRDQVPWAAFQPTLEQLQASGPWQLGSVTSRSDTQLSVEATAADGTAAVVNLSLDSQGHIEGLLVQPGEQPQLNEPVSSLDDAVTRLDALGTVRLAAARIEVGACVTTDGTGADDLAPIGSIFKLYVLGAVVTALDTGTLSWEDQLTITDQVKSLPSGVLQNRADGSTVTVNEAVELMITISDNTATDLLIDAVGRDAVEQALSDWGHDEPGRNQPVMTTREFFQLKAADDAVQDRWIAGDEATRRSILEELATQDLPPLTVFDDGPVHPDEIEWFASPTDLCRVLAGLYARMDETGMEPLRRALTANPGVAADQDQWAEIVFKGGSEPGLLAAAFLVEDAQGQVFTLTGSVVRPDGGLDQTKALLLFAGARDTLGSGSDTG